MDRHAMKQAWSERMQSSCSSNKQHLASNAFALPAVVTPRTMHEVHGGIETGAHKDQACDAGPLPSLLDPISELTDISFEGSKCAIARTESCCKNQLQLRDLWELYGRSLIAGTDSPRNCGHCTRRSQVPSASSLLSNARQPTRKHCLRVACTRITPDIL